MSNNFFDRIFPESENGELYSLVNEKALVSWRTLREAIPIRGLSKVFCVCGICGEGEKIEHPKDWPVKSGNFWKRLWYFYSRGTQMTEVFALGSHKECVKKKLSMLNTWRKEKGLSPNTGKHKTQEEKDRAVAARRASGVYTRLSAARKGKKIEDIYGEETASRVRLQTREARLLQKDPRLGTHHSEASKAQMSRSATNKFLMRPELLEENGRKIKAAWQALPLEEKIRRSSFYHSRKTNTGAYKGIRYESSWELAFLFLSELHDWKEVTRSNNWIKYDKPEGDVGLYNPDFSYKDSTGVRIVVEVKPANFLKEDSPYGKITRAKLLGAAAYFNREDVIFKVFTENEIGEELIAQAKEYHAKNKQSDCPPESPERK